MGCRVRAPKTDLLRVVAGPGGVVPDPRGRLPGRGASLHPDVRCLDLAERRRVFPRALRLPGPLDTAPLRAHLEALAHPGTPSPADRAATSTTGTPSTTDPSPPTGSRSRPR